VTGDGVGVCIAAGGSQLGASPVGRGRARQPISPPSTDLPTGKEWKPRAFVAVSVDLRAALALLSPAGGSGLPR